MSHISVSVTEIISNNFIFYIGNTSLNAFEWGWSDKNNVMVPITTDMDIAPPGLQSDIRCNCKVSSKNPCSTKSCTCKKYGMPCIAACYGCRREECNNCDVSFDTLQVN